MATLLIAMTPLLGAACSNQPRLERDELLAEARRDYDLGRFAASKEVLSDLLEEDSGNLDARRQLALTLAATGDNEGALEQYQQIVKNDPGDHESLFRMALIERLLGNLDSAVNRLAEATEAAPGSASYLVELAKTETMRGNHLAAIDMWQTLVSGEEDVAIRARYLVGLGEAYEAAGQLGRARAAYGRAIELAPSDPAASQRIDELP